MIEVFTFWLQTCLICTCDVTHDCPCCQTFKASAWFQDWFLSSQVNSLSYTPNCFHFICHSFALSVFCTEFV